MIGERGCRGVVRASVSPKGLADLGPARRGRANGTTTWRRVGVAGTRRRDRSVRAQAVVESLHSVDPAHLHDHITQALYSLADADVVAADPQKKAGFFNFFAVVLETFLKGIDGVLEFVHVPYSYGFSIILLTILVKAGTFPLSKKQLESNLQIQSLQPQINKLKELYADDQEKLQLETAKLYKVADVNPLAGCLPTFVSLPIYIGLYRSLTNAAEEGLLTEGFFWIPSLAGPTTIAARQAGTGSAWLFPFQDGAPPIGWHDATSYLILPLMLIATQYASQKILSGQQQQSQQNETASAIIKFLPLMIGWFSLNVPAGLTLYWFTNNLLSIGQTAFLRANFKAPEIADATSTSGAMEVERVSAVSQKQVPPPPKRTGEKFWELKNKESGGSVVAEVLSKPAEPKKGSKFYELKAKEMEEGVSKPQVAEVAEVVQSVQVADVVEEDKTEASNGARAAQGQPKKPGFKKKGKRGKGYQKKKK
ncbi:membrane protein insertase [Chloropicon primus]|uniref:Membrane protein insertase n=2 Tax=Chloropicon primus TaxID=1764295 RepID=A0A5B8MHX8_9CHLO|nr:membrane protein insertase [Chloropicon primus]UPQ99288.1 membrane protein insertase [Chloropicon primus]|eukprot:QDZ20076.1 membrane protein insertase [Chloropicon primus]